MSEWRYRGLRYCDRSAPGPPRGHSAGRSAASPMRARRPASLEIFPHDVHELPHPSAVGMFAQRSLLACPGDRLPFVVVLKVIANQLRALVVGSVSDDFLPGRENLVQVLLPVGDEQRAHAGALEEA